MRRSEQPPSASRLPDRPDRDRSHLRSASTWRSRSRSRSRATATSSRRSSPTRRTSAPRARSGSPASRSARSVGRSSTVTDANGNGRGRRDRHDGPRRTAPCRSTRTPRCSCGRASSSRATCSSTCTRAARAPELASGSLVPENQTSNSVQLDQVLTDAPGAGTAGPADLPQRVRRRPRPSTAAPRASRSSFRTSPAAFKYTSQVNQALLGTQPGDLAGFVSNLDVVARGSNSNERAAPGPDHQPRTPSAATSPPHRLARARRSSSCRARSPPAAGALQA